MKCIPLTQGEMRENNTLLPHNPRTYPYLQILMFSPRAYVQPVKSFVNELSLQVLICTPSSLPPSICMSRRCLTLNPRRRASWASGAGRSSRSWTTPTPTGGKASTKDRWARSPATTSRQSTITCNVAGSDMKKRLIERTEERSLITLKPKSSWNHDACPQT